MTIGVTGGMGCGKTTVSAMFVAAGFRLIDSDQLVREIVLNAPEVLASLRSRFGDGVFDAAGRVDRARLGAVVFANDKDRLWLEDQTHPRVLALWRERLREAPKDKWVIEVPLLFEKGLENWFDFTVCVASAPGQQLARLEQRGFSKPLAEQRISKQLPLAQKIEHSDFVLWNDGSIAFLQKQVDLLIAGLPASS